MSDSPLHPGAGPDDGGVSTDAAAGEPGPATADPPTGVPPAGSEPDPPTDTTDADAAVSEAENAVAGDVDELTSIASERDDYLDALRRLQADFENYKKRVIKQQTDHLERAAESLVSR